MGTAGSEESESISVIRGGYVVDYELCSPEAGRVRQLVDSGTQNDSTDEDWTSASSASSASPGNSDEESDDWDGDGEDFIEGEWWLAEEIDEEERVGRAGTH